MVMIIIVIEQHIVQDLILELVAPDTETLLGLSDLKSSATCFYLTVQGQLLGLLGRKLDHALAVLSVD